MFTLRRSWRLHTAGLPRRSAAGRAARRRRLRVRSLPARAVFGMPSETLLGGYPDISPLRYVLFLDTSETLPSPLRYVLFPPLVVGFLFRAGVGMLSLRTNFGDGGNIEAETNADQSYYAIIYKARILLRSLAARREGGTYGYCSTLFYASLIEIHSVIVPAYLVFLAPAIVMFGYDNAPPSAAPRRPAPHTQLLAGRLSCACRRCTTSPSSSSSCK